MKRRGFTLIELMVAISTIGIIMAGVWPLAFGQYERASRRAVAADAVVRMLDQELEALRACDTRVCLQDSLRAPPSDGWARGTVERTMQPGPDGTIQVTVSVKLPALRTARSASALVGVRR